MRQRPNASGASKELGGTLRTAPGSPHRDDGRDAHRNAPGSPLAKFRKAATAVMAANKFSTPKGGDSRQRPASLSDVDAETLNVFAVWSVMAAIYITMFYDFAWGGLGTSNSKGLSFISSLSNSFEFRSQKPMTPRKKPRTKAFARHQKRGSLLYCIVDEQNGWTHRIWLFAAATMVKYGASTVVSLCMYVRPVILKGPRHFIQFGVAFFFVQLCPGDWAYHALKTPAVRVVVRLAGSLYKHRKFLFVVETYAPRTSLFSWFMMIFLGVIIIDGTSLLRRTENAFMNRGVSYTTRTKFAKELRRAWTYTWTRCRSSVCWTLGMGLCTSIREHVISMVRSESQLWCVQLVNTFYYLAKVAVFIFFLDRSLKTIWKDSVGTFEALGILRKPMNTNGDAELSSPALAPSGGSWSDIPALALDNPSKVQQVPSSPGRRQRQVRSRRSSGDNGNGTQVVSEAACGAANGPTATPRGVAFDRAGGKPTAATPKVTPYTKARRVLGFGTFGVGAGGDGRGVGGGFLFNRGGGGGGDGGGGSGGRGQALKKFSSSGDVPYPLYDSPTSTTGRGDGGGGGDDGGEGEDPRVSLSAVWSVEKSQWIVSPPKPSGASEDDINGGVGGGHEVPIGCSAASGHGATSSGLREPRRNSAPTLGRSSLQSLFEDPGDGHENGHEIDRGNDRGKSKVAGEEVGGRKLEMMAEEEEEEEEPVAVRQDPREEREEREGTGEERREDTRVLTKEVRREKDSENCGGDADAP